MHSSNQILSKDPFKATLNARTIISTITKNGAKIMIAAKSMTSAWPIHLNSEARLSTRTENHPLQCRQATVGSVDAIRSDQQWCH